MICLVEDVKSAASYSELVSLIEGAERESVAASSVSAGSVIIDLAAAIGQTVNMQRKRYADVITEIEEVEAPRRYKEEKVKEQKEAPEHIIMAGVEQAKYSNPVPSPFIAEEEAAKKELESIKEKLGEIAPAIKEMGRKKVSTKDLVLPSLSLSDQIAELERIVEGVKENIFDEEHLEIVKQEVYGLNAVAEKAERDRKRSKVQVASSVEDSLIAIRQQRLHDAMNLLQNR